MKHLYSLVIIFLTLGIQAQEDLNIELVSNIQINEIGNDIWGWVDSTGTEYAIMGSQRHVWIWSLADPANPQQIAQIRGDGSTWRDIKSWEDHLYVTTDSGDDGLLIIDMSMAPDSIRSHYITPPVIANGDTTALGPCHNLYIDENGFAYLAGCRINYANKALIFDLNTDKWNPEIVGVHSQVPGGGDYAHDLYVKNNILYASEIYQGQLGIYDVTRKDSLIVLGTQQTGFNFTHNAWSSTDQNYVFTTDERANAFVEAYDVSDPTDISFLDRYQPLETQNTGVIPHNTHYYDGYLVTSWYTDGVIVVDASKPDNLIKTGAYDTFDGPNGDFNGCWGAYPYLPSGLLLASDRQTGLYVLQPDYKRAARMEGLVTDEATGNPVTMARVQIQANQVNFDDTDAKGAYKTGIAAEGTFIVDVTHPDYEPFSTGVDLVNGEVTTLDIALKKIRQIQYTVKLESSVAGQTVSNAHVIFNSETGQESFFTDTSGVLVTSLPAKAYTVQIGAWGFQPTERVIDENMNNETIITLDPGYTDDFSFDLGWTVNGTAVSGIWERGVPNGTIYEGQFMAPPFDIGTDNGESCYVTGNTNNLDPSVDDVDDGTTVLISPEIILEDYMDPYIQFQYWYNTGGGNGMPNDTFRVFVYTAAGDSTEIFTEGTGRQGWSDLIELRLSDFIALDQGPVRLAYFAEDQAASGHLVEAAVDGFAIEEKFISSSADLAVGPFTVSPNPFESAIRIQFEDNSRRTIELFDLTGRRILSRITTGQSYEFTPVIEAGQYILRLTEEDGKGYSEKIIKI